MTDKLTIELLCEMLEERGISCHTHYLHAFWWVGPKLYEAADNLDGTLTVGRLTPKQVIAATLGSGECEIVEHYAASTRGEIGRDRVKLPCGHIAERHSKFCQECGAKVVER